MGGMRAILKLACSEWKAWLFWGLHAFGRLDWVIQRAHWCACDFPRTALPVCNDSLHLDFRLQLSFGVWCFESSKGSRVAEGNLDLLLFYPPALPPCRLLRSFTMTWKLRLHAAVAACCSWGAGSLPPFGLQRTSLKILSDGRVRPHPAVAGQGGMLQGLWVPVGGRFK